LAKHFLAYRNVAEKLNKTFTPEAVSFIQQQRWPGNVRELKHAIERAYILADDTIDRSHFNSFETGSQTENMFEEVKVPTGMRLDEIEKIAIYQALEQADGNKNDTAEQLGISVKTLYNKLSKYEDNSNAD
jgi:DNA-binding NtrC family response regulator